MKPTEIELDIIALARTIIETYPQPWKDPQVANDLDDRLTEYIIYQRDYKDEDEIEDETEPSVIILPDNHHDTQT